MIDTAKAWLFLQKLRRDMKTEPETRRAVQAKVLRPTLEHAWANVPFYREHWKRHDFHPDSFNSMDDLPRIPVVTAPVLREAIINQSLLTKGVPPEDCNPLVSSGSSGEPMNYLKMPLEDRIRRAGGLLIFLEHGFRWSDMTVQFQSYSDPGHPLQRFGISRKRWCLTVDPLQKQLGVYLEAKPEIVIGAPKALRELCLYMDNEGVRPPGRPRVVFAAGEYLDVESRRVIKKVLGTEPTGIFGQTEVGFSMWQCEARDRYHITATTHVVEVLDPQGNPVASGERGSLVTTELRARTMPVIRYDSGDIATTIDGPCSCGRTLPAIRSIDGREIGSLAAQGGRAVTTSDIVDHLAPVLRIGTYRIVPRADGSVNVQLSREAGVGAGQEGTVADSLAGLLGAVPVTVTRDFEAHHTCATKTHTVVQP